MSGSMRFEIVHPDDGDGYFQIGITASSNEHKSFLEVWTTWESLGELAEGFASFPEAAQREFVWEEGSRDAKTDIFCRLRAFLHDSRGHAAIEVEFERHSNSPYYSNNHFFLLCEAASINHLGEKIRLFRPNGVCDPAEVLLWQS